MTWQSQLALFWRLCSCICVDPSKAFGLSSCTFCLLADHATDEWPPLRQADSARWCRRKLHLLKHSQQRPRPAAPSPRGVPRERKGERGAEHGWEPTSILASPGSRWALKFGAFQNGLYPVMEKIRGQKHWLLKGVGSGLYVHLHYWFNFVSCAPGASSARLGAVTVPLAALLLLVNLLRAVGRRPHKP